MWVIFAIIFPLKKFKEFTWLKKYILWRLFSVIFWAIAKGLWSTVFFCELCGFLKNMEKTSLRHITDKNKKMIKTDKQSLKNFAVRIFFFCWWWCMIRFFFAFKTQTQSRMAWEKNNVAPCVLIVWPPSYILDLCCYYYFYSGSSRSSDLPCKYFFFKKKKFQMQHIECFVKGAIFMLFFHTQKRSLIALLFCEKKSKDFVWLSFSTTKNALKMYSWMKRSLKKNAA